MVYRHGAIGSFSDGDDSTVWRAGGFFVGILGRCLGDLICAGSTSVSSERRLLGCGISFWRHPAVPGRADGGVTAQGTPHGRRLASASTADGIFNQRRMGYRHRAHSQAFNQLVQQSRKTNARLCKITFEPLLFPSGHCPSDECCSFIEGPPGRLQCGSGRFALPALRTPPGAARRSV
jgi:hypothetical protein